MRCLGTSPNCFDKTEMVFLDWALLNSTTVLPLKPIPLATLYRQITKHVRAMISIIASHSVMGSLPAGMVLTQMEFKPSFAKLSLALIPIATL